MDKERSSTLGNEKYMEGVEILELIGEVKIDGFATISQDSYSDKEIWNTIKRIKGQKNLLCCAIQTAIVGYGNKSFGEFMMSEERVDVKSLYDMYGVKNDLDQNAKIKSGDLTPRRLQRFFRAHISKYIKDHKEVNPYLWKKYSTMEEEYRHICFPGAESLIKTQSEAQYLIETYLELDRRLGINISERVQRILTARGIWAAQK